MEVIAPVGLGIAIVQARSILTSIENRIGNYRKGPETFQSLRDSVDRLKKNLGDVDTLIETFPSAMPSEISSTFDETIKTVRNTLKSANESMEGSFSIAFAGGSSCMCKVKSKALRTFRSKKLNDSMNSVEAKITSASFLLLELTSIVVNRHELQEHQAIVLPMLENLAVIETSKDIFRPITNTPALTDVFKLDFDAKDAAGRPTTPEAVLKLSVLSSDSSSSITAAAGVLKSAYSIVGMAGVGKTVALRGLAYDKDVKVAFQTEFSI